MIYERKQINIETHAVLFLCLCQQQFPNQNAGLFAVRRYKSVNNYLHTYSETVYLFLFICSNECPHNLFNDLRL